MSSWKDKLPPPTESMNRRNGPIGVRVDDSIRDWLTQIANAHNTSINKVVVAILETEYDKWLKDALITELGKDKIGINGDINGLGCDPDVP